MFLLFSKTSSIRPDQTPLEYQRAAAHLVRPSPWPFTTAFALDSLLLTTVVYNQKKYYSNFTNSNEEQREEWRIECITSIKDWMRLETENDLKLRNEVMSYLEPLTDDNWINLYWIQCDTSSSYRMVKLCIDNSIEIEDFKVFIRGIAHARKDSPLSKSLILANLSEEKIEKLLNIVMLWVGSKESFEFREKRWYEGWTTSDYIQLAIGVIFIVIFIIVW